MAYTISKTSKIIEELQLEDGPLIKVNIDPSLMATKINEANNNVIRVQMKLGTVTPDKIGEVYEEIGIAAIELLKVIFGEEDTETLLKYYEDNYIELIENVIPFVHDVVVKRINEYVKAKNKKTKGKYKRGIFNKN